MTFPKTLSEWVTSQSVMPIEKLQCCSATRASERQLRGGKTKQKAKGLLVGSTPRQLSLSDQSVRAASWTDLKPWWGGHWEGLPLAAVSGHMVALSCREMGMSVGWLPWAKKRNRIYPTTFPSTIICTIIYWERVADRKACVCIFLDDSEELLAGIQVKAEMKTVPALVPAFVSMKHWHTSASRSSSWQQQRAWVVLRLFMNSQLYLYHQKIQEERIKQRSMFLFNPLINLSKL